MVWEGQGVNEIGRRADTKEIVIRIDSRYFRPTEVDELVGDSEKGFSKLGWFPEITLEEMIEEIIRSEIEMYNYRSYEEIDLLEFMGRACPAFGMIGTVVGLILMLGSTTSGGADIAGVMGGMSVALITTLYGVLLAQIIFLPIASKRYQIKETQVLLMEMMREGLLYLKRRELPETAAKDLIIYLPPKLRKKILLEEQAAMNQDLGL